MADAGPRTVIILMTYIPRASVAAPGATGAHRPDSMRPVVSARPS